ncbi:MAG: PEP-utilizing enzyme [Acidimicrobiia bacterium]|nr:PEP-utilizing enzyme [Acidimicrobiia bacterium]
MRDRWLTDWPTSERFPHYTRANAGEVLSDPVSPLGWTFGWDGGIVEGYKQGLIRCGVYEDADFDEAHPETVASFGGYFYINLSAIRMQGARNPAASVELLDQAFFGDHPDVPPYVAHPDDDKPHLIPAIETHSAWVMSGDPWTDLDDDKRAAAELRRDRPQLSALTSEHLLERARAVQARLPHLFSQHVVSGTSAAVAPGLLAVVADTLDEPGIPMTLLSTLGEVDSADANYALWDLSRIIRGDPEVGNAFDGDLDGLLDRVASPTFIAAWDDFIYEFGSRGPDEWDLRAPTWETHPQLALAALERLRLQSDEGSPRLRAARRATERDELIATSRTRLADDPETLGLLEAGLVAGRLMAHRERTKTTIVRVLHEARMSFRELGARSGHDELVFQLLDDELDAYIRDPDAFTDLLTSRHRAWRELFTLLPPFIIADADVPPLSEWERRTDTPMAEAAVGTVLSGVAGSPGIARGLARVVLEPADPGALAPGDVLVAPNTDPSWTPLFMAAAGVVVDVGGQISHAVIVSRELAVPCVVSVTDGTRAIPDGALIEVDGTSGTVTILEAPQSGAVR